MEEIVCVFGISNENGFFIYRGQVSFMNHENDNVECDVNDACVFSL